MNEFSFPDVSTTLTCILRRRLGRYQVDELIAAVSSALMLATFAYGAPAIAASGGLVVVANAFATSDAAAALSGLTEGNRHRAIVSMVRSGQLRGPLSAADGALILNGTSRHIRTASIAELARLFKADLTGQEAATILGPPAGLSEGNRHGAIASLSRARRFGPTLSGDAALALDGTTQHIRAASIAALAPHLRADMRSQQIVEILGGEQVLSEGNRHGAIATLARSKRIPQGLTAAEAVPILAGTTARSRAASIAELARFLMTALSGEDTAAILGRNGETTERDRLSAITALARAGKLRPGFSGQEMTAVLQGTSDQARAAAIGEVVASSAKLAASPAPTKVTETPPLSGSEPRVAGNGSDIPSPSNSSTTAGSTPATLDGAKPLPKLLGSELTDTAEAYEFALLAAAVYEGTSPIELETRSGKVSWRQLDRQIQTYPGTSFSLGFKASTYLRRTNVKGEWLCAVVFAGTDGPEPVDWANNILQVAGALVPEYEQGASYAKKIADGVCKSHKVVFVGHSLGGGIAQYAFVRTGGAYQARTFNSAGLSWLKSSGWKAYAATTKVINFIADPFDASDGKRLVGREPASVTGQLIGKKILVPVYGYRATHLISVLQEGVGIQRDYCLAGGGCN